MKAAEAKGDDGIEGITTRFRNSLGGRRKNGSVLAAESVELEGPRKGAASTLKGRASARKGSASVPVIADEEEVVEWDE